MTRARPVVEGFMELVCAARAFVVALVGVVLGTGVAAQQVQPGPARVSAAPRVAGGIGVLAAVPVGAFSEHVDSAGGVLAHLDTRLGRGPFRLGGEIGYLEYGYARRNVPLRPLVPEIPDAVLNVETKNAMFLMHARLRAARGRGRWRPYADALAGFTDLFTDTSIAGGITCVPGVFGGVTCTTSDAASSTNSRDFVFSFGGAGGVTYAFHPRWPRLDLALRYVRGGNARYLTEGAIRVDGAQARFDFSESRTDSVALYIGLSMPR
jgi:hypothetical protein